MGRVGSNPAALLAASTRLTTSRALVLKVRLPAAVAWGACQQGSNAACTECWMAMAL